MLLSDSEYIDTCSAWILEQKPVVFITHTNEPYGEVVTNVEAKGARGRSAKFAGWEVTEKRLRLGYHLLSRTVYGRNYWRSGGVEGVCWAGSLEPQKNGAPHAHSVCWAPGRDLLEFFTDRKTVRRGQYTREVIPSIEDHFRQAGFGRIVAAEVITKPAECGHYVVKYSVKHGGMLVGGNWKPPADLSSATSANMRDLRNDHSG